MVKNDELYKSLENNLSKNKFFKKKEIKQDFFYEKLLKKNNYDLIGWQTLDIYQNLSITYLSSVKKNELLLQKN